MNLFNALELLTAQYPPDLKAIYGRLLNLFGKGIKKKLINGHYSGQGGFLRILIISDLKHLDISDKINEAIEGVFLAHLRVHFPQEWSELNRTLHEPSQGDLARFVNAFSEAEGDGKKDLNLDLDHVYNILDGIPTDDRIKWVIARTLYSDDVENGKVVVEKTVSGLERRSAMWDSSKDCPFAGPFDLILLRRGLCYCRPFVERSCCGCGPNGSDWQFLKKVHNLLRDNKQSAAYLGGWNPLVQKDSVKWWMTACESATNRTQGDRVFTVIPCEMKANLMAGVFVSRGKAHPDVKLGLPDRILAKYRDLDNRH
jgi:hypothetical protein